MIKDVLGVSLVLTGLIWIIGWLSGLIGVNFYVLHMIVWMILFYFVIDRDDDDGA